MARSAAVSPANCAAGSCTATVTYTPTADYSGEDSFTYLANDGTNDSEPATVSITVTAHVAPIVINTNDSGPGSLRQALLDSQDGDTIGFEIPSTDAGCTSVGCVITLTTPVSITNDITLDGPTTGTSVMVSGGGTTRVFNVATEATAVLSHLTVVNGFSNTDGGGIQNSGELTIVSSTLSNNTVAGDGGAIRNDGTLRLVNSTLSGNHATLNGGAIANGDGRSLTIGNVTLVKNRAEVSGGGVMNAGTVTIRNSIIALNSAATGDNIFTSAGNVVSGGYNLTNDSAAGAFIATGDQVNTDPLLGPLKEQRRPHDHSRAALQQPGDRSRPRPRCDGAGSARRGAGGDL